MKSKVLFLIVILIFLSGCNISYKVEKSLPNTSKGVFYSDNFSNPESGWDRFQNDTGVTDYSNAGYMIYIKKENFIKWANPSATFPNDLRITVDVNKQDGPDDNAYGLICRYQDPDNFYYFLISSDGYGGIGRRLDGTLKIISSSDAKLVPLDAINKGAANHLEVDCIGDTLTLFVNGTQVLEVVDDTFKSGTIGLVSRTYSMGGTGILFNNLVVRKP